MAEGKAWLRDYAIKLYDRGDGHAADWPLLAQAMFAAAFSLLDEAGGDERALKVLRRAEEGVYQRLARNPDDGLPPVLGEEAAPGGKPALPRLPEPRHRP